LLFSLTNLFGKKISLEDDVDVFGNFTGFRVAGGRIRDKSTGFIPVYQEQYVQNV
jgi:hypothetical protein